MKKLKIYLSGHVPEYKYRKYCIDTYGNEFDLFDPISMVPENQDYITVVEDDKEAIRKSDILIAYIRKASFGTGMEIPYAYDLMIPVLIVDPTEKWKDDTWLIYHSEEIFKTIDECFSYIRETYMK